MGYLRYIVYIVCTLLIALPLSAKKSTPSPAWTTEQEQQFTYYWYAARQAIEEQRFDEAYALLEFCNLLKPNDALTLSFLATLYQGMEQYDRALEYYRLAFESDPAEQWFKYSHALIGLRTPESIQTALVTLEKAYDVQKKNAKKRHTPVDENLLEQLKRLYLNAKRWKDAIRMQDEIDAIKGYDMFSAMSRYRSYALWGKTKKAIEELDRYLQIDPTNIRFMLFRVELLETHNAKKEVLYAQYEQILALDPLFVSILNNYAFHLATHKGDLKKAERMSEITIREEPNNPTYLDTYGWILHLQGQDELALFYLQRALQETKDEQMRIEVNNHIKQIRK